MEQPYPIITSGGLIFDEKKSKEYYKNMEEAKIKDILIKYEHEKNKIIEKESERWRL